MFKLRSKDLIRFANAAKVASHRADQHVQDDKDRASMREDFPGNLSRGARRTPGQCRKHDWVFDILISFENGMGEMYVCSKCGAGKEANDPWTEEDEKVLKRELENGN